MSETTQDPRGGWTSASNAEADKRCHARHLMQQQVVEPEKRSKDAELGDRLHLALKKRDPSGLPTEELERYEATVILEDKLVAEFFGKNSDHARKSCFREQRYWGQVKTPQGQLLQHSGQPDVVYRYSTDALIIEYKSLYGDIPGAAENEQLGDQAVLVKGHFIIVNRIAVAVIQPSVNIDPDVAIYGKEALMQRERIMWDRVALSNTPGIEPVAGEVQCKFCRAKKYCRQYNAFASQLVPSMLSLMDVAVINWTPAMRAEFLRKKPIAQKWLDECNDDIKDILAKDPDGAPGFKLRPGSIRESITNPEVVFQRFVGLGGTAEQFMPCVSVHKTKFKDQLQKVTGAKGKGLVETLNKTLDGQTVKSQSAPSIVSADEITESL